MNVGDVVVVVGQYSPEYPPINHVGIIRKAYPGEISGRSYFILNGFPFGCSAEEVVPACSALKALYGF